tara:strand:+ start:1338 stop:3134 length:1797 start_codon:yes stop_codon:yes gene_type:complete
MALTKISTGGVKDDAASQAKIADEAVDEARLQISNAGTNGQFLQKQSGNTGGLTWATPTTLIDEDDMASNDATKAPSQQSVKAYVDALSTAPEITANATGAIAQDDPCIVHTDGTFKKVATAIVQQTPAVGTNRALTGTGLNSETTGEKAVVAYSKTLKKVVALYRRTTSSVGATGYGFMTSGNDNGTGGFDGPHGDALNGVEKLVWEGSMYPLGAVHNEATGKFCFMLGNSNKSTITSMVARLNANGTIGGVGTTTIENTSCSDFSLCYDETSEKVIYYYRNSSTGKCYARACTTSSGTNTTQTLGTETTIADFNTNGRVQVTYAKTAGKVVFTYEKTSDGYTYARVATVASDGSFTLGSEVEITQTGGQAAHFECIYSIKDDKVVFLLGDSNTIKIRIGSVTGSGTSATISSLGTEATNSSFISHAFYAVYDETAERVSIIWSGGSPNKAQVTSLIISGNSFTLGAVGTGLSEQQIPIEGTYDYGKRGRYFWTEVSGGTYYTHNSNSYGDKAGMRPITSAVATPNLTAENFIGFAKAAATNGNSCTVKVVGNTTTKSSLTAGQKYYVQTDGSLDTSAGTPSVEAGVALSSTKLLIK